MKILLLLLAQEARAEIKKVERAPGGKVNLTLLVPRVKDKSEVTGGRSLLVHRFDFKSGKLSLAWERQPIAVSGTVERGQVRLEGLEVPIPGFYEFTADAPGRILEDEFLWAPRIADISDLMIAHASRLETDIRRVDELFRLIEKASKDEKKWPENAQGHFKELERIRDRIAKLVHPTMGDEGVQELSETHFVATARFAILVVQEVLDIGDRFPKLPETTPTQEPGHDQGGSDPVMPKDPFGGALSLEKFRERLQVARELVDRENLSWCAKFVRRALEQPKEKGLLDVVEDLLKTRPDEEMSDIVKKVRKGEAVSLDAIETRCRK